MKVLKNAIKWQEREEQKRKRPQVVNNRNPSQNQLKEKEEGKRRRKNDKAGVPQAVVPRQAVHLDLAHRVHPVVLAVRLDHPAPQALVPADPVPALAQDQAETGAKRRQQKLQEERM